MSSQFNAGFTAGIQSAPLCKHQLLLLHHCARETHPLRGRGGGSIPLRPPQPHPCRSFLWNTFSLPHLTVSHFFLKTLKGFLTHSTWARSSFPLLLSRCLSLPICSSDHTDVLPVYSSRLWASQGRAWILS